MKTDNINFSDYDRAVSSPKRDARQTGSFTSALACFLKTISGRSNTTGLLYTSDMCPCNNEAAVLDSK